MYSYIWDSLYKYETYFLFSSILVQTEDEMILLTNNLAKVFYRTNVFFTTLNSGNIKYNKYRETILKRGKQQQLFKGILQKILISISLQPDSVNFSNCKLIFFDLTVFNIHGLKYQRSTTLGWKVKRIIESKCVAKTRFIFFILD